MEMTCNVIKDLMPLYIDKICSEDTEKTVNEHLEICHDCKNIYELMKNPDHVIKISSDEYLKAVNPFDIIKKKNRTIVVIAIFITFIITSVSAYLLIQNVGSIHKCFFPEQNITINKAIDGWEYAKTVDGTYFEFDSIFYNKAIVNDANSDGAIAIIVINEVGDVVMEQFTLNPGKSYSLKSLKDHQSYQFKIFAEKGKYLINLY